MEFNDEEAAMSEVRAWVGVDWATEEHEVAVVDESGRVVARRKVRHDGEELRKFADWVVSLGQGDASRVKASIETPHGSVVASLLERGVAVYSVNPKQVDRFRDRHAVSGAKSDALDAQVLADSLRTDESLFRRVTPPPAQVVELRECVRLHDELAAERQALVQQMREALGRFFPAMLELGDLDSQWMRELVEHVPTPRQAQRPAASIVVQQALKAGRVRKFTHDEVMEKLRRPAVPVAAGVEQAARMRIRSILPRLKLVERQLTDCDGRMEEIQAGFGESAEGQKGEHRDVDIILSLPGVGTYVAATMLSEAWEALESRNYHAARALAGVAPVTRQTGKQRHGARRAPRPQVSMRRACSKRLRNAMHHAAARARDHDAHANKLYRDARARGCSDGQALRIVADRWLGILTAMLRTRTTYDPAKWQGYAATTEKEDRISP